MRQDSTIVTIDDNEVLYALSIGAKFNDLGWPWRVIMDCISKHVRHACCCCCCYLFI